MTYRKSGSAVRWENGKVIRVVEEGTAAEEGDLFTCRPGRGERPPPLDPAAVVNAARDVERATAGVDVERLIVTEGLAEHEYEGNRWSERSQRMHLSLVRGNVRALVDVGSFAVTDVERIALVLARCEAGERPSVPRLRLAPNVTAALLSSLAGVAPPNVRLLQTAGGIDGKGKPVVEASGEWPNWYRPSYRIRPIRVPHNLRIECDVTAIDYDLPVAVALVGPPDGLTVRVLVDGGRDAYTTTVRVTRIDAVGTERVWYPYGAGSFGAEMML